MDTWTTLAVETFLWQLHHGLSAWMIFGQLSMGSVATCVQSVSLWQVVLLTRS